jgi:hypothetical protein
MRRGTGPMNERQQIRTFQKLKSLSNKSFWTQMNVLHSKAYYLGQKHVEEAMACTPRISKNQIKAVMAKAVEIQEQWDRMKTITVEDTENMF